MRNKPDGTKQRERTKVILTQVGVGGDRTPGSRKEPKNIETDQEHPEDDQRQTDYEKYFSPAISSPHVPQRCWSITTLCQCF